MPHAGVSRITDERPGWTAYVLPNDDLEMERLDVTHTMVARALGERLYLAPVDKEKVQRILDVGTGTGICELTDLEAARRCDFC